MNQLELTNEQYKQKYLKYKKKYLDLKEELEGGLLPNINPFLIINTNLKYFFVNKPDTKHLEIIGGVMNFKGLKISDSEKMFIRRARVCGSDDTCNKYEMYDLYKAKDPYLKDKDVFSNKDFKKWFKTVYEDVASIWEMNNK